MKEGRGIRLIGALRSGGGAVPNFLKGAGMTSRISATGWLLAAVFIFLPFSVSGCGSKKIYTGERLPAGQIAVLEIGRLRVLMVDDLPTPHLKARRLELLPGVHFIRATVDVDLYEGPIITYRFNAEPGGKYLFDADIDMSRGVNWTPWIKDRSSGKVIGVWMK